MLYSLKICGNFSSYRLFALINLYDIDSVAVYIEQSGLYLYILGIFCGSYLNIHP